MKGFNAWMKANKSKRPAAEQDEIVGKVRALNEEALALGPKHERYQEIIQEVVGIMGNHEAEFDLLDRIVNTITGNEDGV